MTLGERLKELRNLAGLTVRDAAIGLGISPGYVSRVEVRGEIPSSEYLVRAAMLFEADAEELLTLSKSTQMERTEREIDEKNHSALILFRKEKR